MNLYDDYKRFERIAKAYDGSGILDTSRERFLAPTTLIPLLCFVKKNNIHQIIPHNNTEDYILRILKGKETSTNTPYTILPKTDEERVNRDIVENMVDRINENYGGRYSIFHVCNELVNNIYNHTPFKKGYASQGYTYAQEYPNKKLLDITVMDDGLSIPKKFEMYGIDFKDDRYAIFEAINHKSTAKEDEPNLRYSRGYGLWSTLKLVVDGNGGSALIISRNGCLHIKKKDKYKYYSLDNNSIFRGTLVSLRFKKNYVQNYHELQEIDTTINYEIIE